MGVQCPCGPCVAKDLFSVDICMIFVRLTMRKCIMLAIANSEIIVDKKELILWDVS